MILDHYTPLGCVPGGVLHFGKSYLRRISGDNPIADSRNVRFKGRDVP